MNEKKKYHVNVVDLLISLVMLGVSIYGLITGVSFGVIENGRPSTGFQPVFASVILSISSVCLLSQTIKNGTASHDADINADSYENAQYRRDTETCLGKFLEKIMPNAKIRYAVLFTLLIAIIIKFIDLFGMYFGLFLMNFLFYKYLSKYSLVKSIVLAALVTGILYVVFSLLLGLRMPAFLNILL